MPYFREKPVEIEAMQFIEESKDAVYSWARVSGANVEASRDDAGRPVLVIHTLEGEMRASLGDWVIRGFEGDFCPCKPDVFEAIYEPVESAEEAR